jgi:hypothetical protein
MRGDAPNAGAVFAVAKEGISASRSKGGLRWWTMCARYWNSLLGKGVRPARVGFSVEAIERAR